MSRPATKPAPVVVHYEPLARAQAKIGELGTAASALVAERATVERDLATARAAIPSDVERAKAKLRGDVLEVDPEAPARVATLEARLAAIGVELEATYEVRREIAGTLGKLAEDATAALSEQLRPEARRLAQAYMAAVRQAREASMAVSSLFDRVAELRPDADHPTYLNGLPLPDRRLLLALEDEVVAYREGCASCGIDVPACDSPVGTDQRVAMSGAL